MGKAIFNTFFNNSHHFPGFTKYTKYTTPIHKKKVAKNRILSDSKPLFALNMMYVSILLYRARHVSHFCRTNVAQCHNLFLRPHTLIILCNLLKYNK